MLTEARTVNGTAGWPSLMLPQAGSTPATATASRTRIPRLELMGVPHRDVVGVASHLRRHVERPHLALLRRPGDARAEGHDVEFLALGVEHELEAARRGQVVAVLPWRHEPAIAQAGIELHL